VETGAFAFELFSQKLGLHVDFDLSLGLYESRAIEKLLSDGDGLQQ
jgi:hypothetical protein